MSELSSSGSDAPVNYADVAPVEQRFVTAKGTRPIDHSTGEAIRQPCEHQIVSNPEGKFVLDLAAEARAALALKFAAKGRTGSKRK